MNQRKDVVARDLLATLQEVQLDDELEAHDLAAELLDELGQRFRRPAGGEDVVVDHHPRAVVKCVGPELERVLAILERVLGADRLQRQLPGAAGRYEAATEL